MKHELVIFDWDGTLMDSAAKIVKCMQMAANDVELPIPTKMEVEHIIGISLAPAVAKLFRLSDEQVVHQVVERYKHHFIHSDIVPCELFPGVIPLLEDLAADKRLLAVATGKARRGLNRAWEHTNTGRFFQHSRCADEAQSKPSADMLEQLLTETGFKASQAVMIGDTTYDMQMAKTLGIDRIAVNYGVHHEDELKQFSPIFIADSVAQLHQFLLRNLNPS